MMKKGDRFPGLVSAPGTVLTLWVEKPLTQGIKESQATVEAFFMGTSPFHEAAQNFLTSCSRRLVRSVSLGLGFSNELPYSV